jgi:hypothetical protein
VGRARPRFLLSNVISLVAERIYYIYSIMESNLKSKWWGSERVLFGYMFFFFVEIEAAISCIIRIDYRLSMSFILIFSSENGLFDRPSSYKVNPHVPVLPTLRDY